MAKKALFLRFNRVVRFKGRCMNMIMRSMAPGRI